MNRLKQQNNPNAKPKGMGLVEVIVAIAISIVTLTSSVVFATRLSMRAQQTFVEESVLQLQTIINEQLRLVEQGLKRDVQMVDGQANPYSLGAFLPANPPVHVPPRMTWQQFCSSTPYNYFSMNLPSFSSSFSDHRIILSVPNGVPVTTPEDQEVDYIFTPVSGNSVFGSFTSIPVEIGIRKSVDPSNSGLGNNITIKTIIRYRLYKNQYTYTKPQELRMIYRLVCPT